MTTGTNKHLRKWKLMGPVSDRPFQSIQSTVLFGGRSLRRRRWSLSFASTSVPPFSSIASPVLKVCLMRLIQRDRTRYTATKARIPLSSGPSRSASSGTIGCLRFRHLIYSIPLLPSLAIVRYGNEPLIGNCTLDSPNPITVLLHTAPF